MTLIEDWMGQGTAADVTTVVLFGVAALGSYFLMRLLLPIAHRTARRSDFLWDDIFADRRLRHRVALLAPAVLLYIGSRAVADESSSWREFLLRTSAALLIFVGALTISAVLHAANSLYESKPISKDRPIEPYVQLAVIVVFMFTVVFVVAVLADRSPWFFVSGLTAITAVVLLVFRDTILSFLASVQLASSDMVDVGDWIEMPEFGVDGEVIDVALHTVTFQNFDKAIVTVPTHSLVSHSFRNWKGMIECGERRIKRSIHIDMSSIRFLTDNEIEAYSKHEPLCKYMAIKRLQLAEDRLRGEPNGDPRRLTNIGTLRAYIGCYLQRQEALDTSGMPFLVRQLQPEPNGLPLEIYVFANTTDWAEFEGIQADVFDHILAMVPEFGLRLFQHPTGADVRVPQSAPPQKGPRMPYADVLRSL